LDRAARRRAAQAQAGHGGEPADDKGEIVVPTFERIDQLMEIWPVFEAIERLHVGPALTRHDEKKRLIALARWHFRGGQSYCQGCASVCATCPYEIERPQTEDGVLAWSVIIRTVGQVRAGMGGAYGLDFTAVLLLAEAMGGALTPLLAELPARDRADHHRSLRRQDRRAMSATSVPPDASSFRRAQSQITAEMAAAIERARRNL
jgi:hypothetical protein